MRGRPRPQSRRRRPRGRPPCVDGEPRREAQLVRVALADRIAAAFDQSGVRERGVARDGLRPAQARRWAGGRPPRHPPAPRTRRARRPGRRPTPAVLAWSNATKRSTRSHRSAGTSASATLTGAPARAAAASYPSQPTHPPRKRPAAHSSWPESVVRDTARTRSGCCLDHAGSDPAPAGRRVGSGIQPEAVRRRRRDRSEDGCRIPPARERHGDRRLGHAPRVERRSIDLGSGRERVPHVAARHGAERRSRAADDPGGRRDHARDQRAGRAVRPGRHDRHHRRRPPSHRPSRASSSIIAVVIGALIGESIGFWLGRYLGPKIRHSRLGRRIGEENWERSERYLRRRGGPAIFISRFLPVLHSLVPLTVGMSGYSYRRFLAWTAPACIIWASLYVSVAALRRRHLPRARRSAALSPATSSSGIIVVFLAAGLRRQEGHRTRRAQAPATATKSCPESPRDRFAPRRTWKTEGMPATEPSPVRPKVLWLARLEYRFHAWRERRARARGLTPDRDALPRLRRCRMGARPRAGAHRPPGPARRARASTSGVRGWRSFAAVPVGFAQVRITIGGVTHEVVADRGGVIDTDHPGSARAGLADADDVGRGRRAGRDARVHRRLRCAIRSRLGRRRHRDGDRSPPPAPGRLELLRRRRARPPARPGDGGAHGAARARSRPARR